MTMLLAAVDNGSLSAAAREGGVPVATLSRKVAELEQLVGAELLIRTTRKLTLTDAGERYVVAARRIIDQVRDAERDAAGEYTSPRGDLIVTSSIHFGHIHMLPIITQFLRSHSQINVRLIQHDRNSDLIDEQIDLAVRFGTLPDSGLVATRIGSMRSVICASPSLLDKVGRPARPIDLTRLPCVSTDGPMLSPKWLFRDPDTMAAIEISVVPRLQVSTAATALEAAIAGIGFVRLLNYQASNDIAKGALEEVLPAFQPAPEPVHIVHVPRAQMPLKLRRFIDLATPQLRASLQF